ncbi:MAG: carboxypeptidase regulatory-like domain-containing protein [Blastocatellia bacterium]|nr:carboxypeptidase regulatory-like domain-containing protein [Blastocatellia bacterium]
MRFRKRIQTLLLIVTALALAFVNLPVKAQLQTGRLEVVIKDEEGAKLPAAAVSVSGGLINRTSVTDATGTARFLVLPPGTYKATVTLDAFNGVVQENIDIKSGETETICLTLTLAEVSDELIVTAEAPIVDVTEIVSDAILDEEKLLKILPTRSFQDTIFLITKPLPEIKHPMAIVAPSGDFPAKIMWGGEGPPPNGFWASAPCSFWGLEISGFQNGIEVTPSGAGTTIAYCNLLNNSGNGALFDFSGSPQSDDYSGGIFNSKLSWNDIGATIIGERVVIIQNNEFSNNRGEGVRIQNSSNGWFGGAEPGLGNVVGANGDGMSLIDSFNWTIQGNYLGTNLRLENFGNRGAGIGLAGNSSNNTIGSDSFRASNVIAHNEYGIIAVNGTVGNLFLFNQIFKNVSLGIDLNFDGVTQNDPLDPDGGANRSQNYPELTSATASDTETRIRGGLFSRPNTDFLIQYYVSAEGDSSGHGEGQTPLGSRRVTTNGSGFADVSAFLPFMLPGGQIITALATNLTTNDTSEFSPGVQITGDGQPELELTKTGPENAVCDTDITYTITVRNTGTAAAVGVRVIDDLPKCIGDEVEVTTSQGFSYPASVDTFGVVTILGRMDPGATATITVKARLTKDCFGAVKSSAEVIAEGDANASNNRDDVSTNVECVKITDISVQGKHVIVSGIGFEKGDTIEVNGEDPKKTKFLNSGTLVAKKGTRLLLGCDPANPGRTDVINLRRRRPDGNDAILDTQAFATCP